MEKKALSYCSIKIRFLNLFFSIFLISWFTLSNACIISIKEAADINLIGEYKASEELRGGFTVYSSEKNMSFFFHNGFWYLGNLLSRPVETHYRCVELEGCNSNLSVPPISGHWSASIHGKTPLPVITSSDCTIENTMENAKDNKVPKEEL